MMKVINYSDVIKNKFREEIDASLNALENEYDIRVMLSDNFIELFIEQFYELYMQKKIIYKYLDEMILAFHQVCLVVIQEKDVLEEEYLLECIKYFMLMIIMNLNLELFIKRYLASQ